MLQRSEIAGGVYFTAPLFRIIEKASPPTAPSAPNHVVNLLLGYTPLVLVGFMASIRRLFRRR